MANLNELQKSTLESIHEDLSEIINRLEDAQTDSNNQETVDWNKAFDLLVSASDRVNGLLD